MRTIQNLKYYQIAHKRKFTLSNDCIEIVHEVIYFA